jgi:hypothetical protein
VGGCVGIGGIGGTERFEERKAGKASNQPRLAILGVARRKVSAPGACEPNATPPPKRNPPVRRKAEGKRLQFARAALHDKFVSVYETLI